MINNNADSEYNKLLIFRFSGLSMSLIQMDHADQLEDETDDNYDARKYQVSILVVGRSNKQNINTNPPPFMIN